MTYREMVPVLRESGFSGIYIDIAAYTTEEINELSTILYEEVGTMPIISDNGRLCFYELK